MNTKPHDDDGGRNSNCPDCAKGRLTLANLMLSDEQRRKVCQTAYNGFCVLKCSESKCSSMPNERAAIANAVMKLEDTLCEKCDIQFVEGCREIKCPTYALLSEAREEMGK